MRSSDSVTGSPVPLFLRSTVACAAMLISAPSVLAGCTRCDMVPVVVEELYLFLGLYLHLDSLLGSD